MNDMNEIKEMNDKTWNDMNEWMNESMNEWNKVSSRQSHAHIADPIFQKMIRIRTWQFFTYFMRKRALATVQRTFCRQLRRSRPAAAERETLLRRPRKPLCQKKHEKHTVSRPRVLSSLNSRVPDQLHFPTTWWWWWWWWWWWSGYHDGEKAGHDNPP